MPGVAQDLLMGALDGDGVGDVQFAFQIGAHYDKDSVTKYVYDVSSLIEPSEDDPVERLGAQLGVKTGPALTDKSKGGEPEAPKTDSKKSAKK